MINPGQTATGSNVTGTIDPQVKQETISNKVYGTVGTIDYRSLVQERALPKTLSVEGEKYLTELTRLVTSDKTHFPKAEVIRLPATNAHLFKHDDSGVAIVFSEHAAEYSGNKYKPISDGIGKVMEEISVRCPDVKNREYIIVNPEDYGLFEAMARFIKNIWDYKRLNSITIKEMGMGNSYFRISRNLNYVKQVLNMYSPHGTRAANTLGFVVELCKTEVPANGRPPQDAEYYPILAVAAVDNFAHTPRGFATGNLKESFTPAIIITEAASILPTVNYLPLVLAASYECFLDKPTRGIRPWLSNYHSGITIDSVYNIAKLSYNQETRAPHAALNQQQVQEFVVDMITQSFLAFSYQEGRAGIPGSALLANPSPEARNKLNAIFSYVLQENVNLPSFLVPGQQIIHEFTGKVMDVGGEARDTRYFDYFRVLHACKNMETAQRFLYGLPIKPEERLDLLNGIGFKDIVSLYNTYTSVIDAGVIEKSASIISRYMTFAPEVTYENSLPIYDYSAISKAYSMHAEQSIFNNNYQRNMYANTSYNGYGY